MNATELKEWEWWIIQATAPRSIWPLEFHKSQIAADLDENTALTAWEIKHR